MANKATEAAVLSICGEMCKQGDASRAWQSNSACDQTPAVGAAFIHTYTQLNPIFPDT